MGIQLFHLMNETPDRVKSSGDDLSNDGKKFVWCLRDKKRPGLNIKLTSVPTTDNSQNDWEISIYNVKWEGEEFVEDSDPRSIYTHSDPQDALSCAEQEIKNICKNDGELEHCINFLR